MQYYHNDTLIMLLWTLRQEQSLSPYLESIYQDAFNEVLIRKSRGQLSQWTYALPMLNNDLSYLTEVDWDIIRALTKTLNLEALQ